LQNKIEPIHIADEDEIVPPQPPERTQTLFFWAAATTIGLFLFNLYFHLLLADRLNAALSGPTGAENSLAVLLVLLPEGVSQGLILGLAQRYVLKRYVKFDYRWVAVSVLGWVVVYSLYFGYVSVPAVQQALGSTDNNGTLLLFEVIRGLAVGVCQWLVLRRWGPPARLWIPIVVIAQVANLLVSRLLSDQTVSSVMGWMAYGLVTGIGIVLILNACWATLLAQGQVVEY